jgi:hypothetical protein
MPRREASSEQNQSRPTSSQRVSREEIPARPSSSQRRSDNESKERVVRDTVSFNRVDAPPSRQSPIPIQPVIHSKPKGLPEHAHILILLFLISFTAAADPDDYEEDFEAYDDDDFEEEEDSKPSKPTPSSAVPKLSSAR